MKRIKTCILNYSFLPLGTSVQAKDERFSGRIHSDGKKNCLVNKAGAWIGCENLTRVEITTVTYPM